MAIKTDIDSPQFVARISELHTSLGIAPGYERSSGLPLQHEPTVLADAGQDMYGRDQRLTPEALSAWQQMRDAAAAEGVELCLVSAFRSVDYQAALIRKKIESGRSLDDVLRVNAAPGFSEHHTGRAIDIASPEDAPLQETFENTRAFKWLQLNAGHFGFVMTYPRGHLHAISYEPWHWCFQLDQ
ncbi:MAG: D-alanyl-D-alanine carboxypeptidase family protein [Pseudohongiella sp.]|nr:D-alanyl-D-alanine carboxypeptidase family protein [Pseudohongiella sp.]MDO9518662.1 D-alanyl-D-alanine carboxypeptidase family protein [Pseudohongiella sp.]MDP2128435.1 D-alanyl-D-alanine carboxypeptidase family protein [Pseudohongiella sp.]